ncbi:hypothetical protein QP735_04295 [Curtobacterium citreum]|uniref:hypothetical protein n=1 Tax=Curtobacterium citreum TaxID=2036 RepID=UPI0025517A79|nr:hypothetical protein [Curtobacterium citreum]MDK8171744.1 hypothetical protein [Curtobacterium citreum]
MYDETGANLRIEALDRAVRVNLSTGGNDATSDTVERATAYLRFLSDEPVFIENDSRGVTIIR